jgi:hypothetical protein
VTSRSHQGLIRDGRCLLNGIHGGYPIYDHPITGVSGIALPIGVGDEADWGIEGLEGSPLVAGGASSAFAYEARDMYWPRVRLTRQEQK